MPAESLSSKPLLLGHSPRSQQIHRLIEKLGRSRWPVLLLGETGTGKEVVARSIYQLNPVGPFVTIDCSAIVGPLMESELFGYVKGAFTGANTTKTGLIESAEGGTAFFDEIGELPLDLQAKLLRVLQQKEFRPVGSLHQRHSDFRIIAATNRDLAQEVENGNFRRDLYYRLNIVTLRLSPLRERKEDIPALVEHFLTRYGQHHRLSSEIMDALLAYDWPGNIRELENCIQHMLAMNSGPYLHTADLPSSLLNPSPPSTDPSKAMAATASSAGTATATHHIQAGVQPVPPAGRPPVTPLIELEKQAILQALAYTKGDRAVAASLLGIGRTTLYRKLKEYQMAV